MKINFEACTVLKSASKSTSDNPCSSCFKGGRTTLYRDLKRAGKIASVNKEVNIPAR